MAVGTIETGQQHMPLMIEIPTKETHRLAFNTNVTVQTHILAQPRTQVDSGHNIRQLSNRHGLAHQLQRRPEQFIGKRDVVCPLRD
jgi:hypothetical protein